jgi:nitrite reductase/ring-hydroxylating ferredoxin subunit
MTEVVSSEVREAESEDVITDLSVPDPGSSVRVSFRGTVVAVFNSGGRLYALEALCGHRNGPLDEGTISGGAVACPWHGAKFDLRTGEVVGGNFFVRRSTRAVRAFEVRAVGGRVVLGERHATASPDPTPVAATAVASHSHPS